MRVRYVVATAAVAVAGFTGAAIAGDHGRDFDTDLSGYEEVPAISTNGGGEMHARIDKAGTEIQYVLRYRALDAPPTQAHIHFGQEGVAGGISVWLCSNLATPPTPPGTQPCPTPDPDATV